MPTVNAIYITVFESPVIVEQSYLLLESLSHNVNNADIIFRTTADLQPDIEYFCQTIDLPIKFWICDLHYDNPANYCYARFEIFEYPEIDQYEKILYMDADVIVSRNIDEIFELEMSNPLMAYNDGHHNVHTYSQCVGSDFYGMEYLQHHGLLEVYADCPVFSGGVILYSILPEVKECFEDASYSELEGYTSKFFGRDQVALNVTATMRGLVNPLGINSFVKNANIPQKYSENDPPIIHFCGGLANAQKTSNMKNFLHEARLFGGW